MTATRLRQTEIQQFVKLNARKFGNNCGNSRLTKRAFFLLIFAGRAKVRFTGAECATGTRLRRGAVGGVAEADDFRRGC